MLGDEDQSSHRREKRYEPSNSIASIQLGFTLYWAFRLHSLEYLRKRFFSGTGSCLRTEVCIVVIDVGNVKLSRQDGLRKKKTLRCLRPADRSLINGVSSEEPPSEASPSHKRWVLQSEMEGLVEKTAAGIIKAASQNLRETDIASPPPRKPHNPNLSSP
ncbi:hypothetical protein DY000_02013659 [Brassica cretica]|uniref:Uncharacterized protein n=1 Tax=Brassica cretica TaxID=69181 RepID=A0ABQ7CXQ3_BRACR|nr:hypothetical protein DY000_02013659 [Brassica cretica]